MARRTADEAEGARRPARELLVGERGPGEVDAEVFAVAALRLLGNLVRELVAVKDFGSSASGRRCSAAATTSSPVAPTPPARQPGPC